MPLKEESCDVSQTCLPSAKQIPVVCKGEALPGVEFEGKYLAIVLTSAIGT